MSDENNATYCKNWAGVCNTLCETCTADAADAMQAKVEELTARLKSTERAELRQIEHREANRRRAEAAEARIAALEEALMKAEVCMAGMAVKAYEVGLEGTTEWDRVAGGNDLFGALDAARAALKGETK